MSGNSRYNTCRAVEDIVHNQVNVQNIPSHALDIRHMFRASPGHREDVPCSQQANTLVVSTPYINSVQTPQGLVKVRDLTTEHTVKLTNGGLDYFLKVVDLENGLDQRTITFAMPE